MSVFRILIVDDEPDIRKVVERSLARDPELTVRSCARGQDALTQAAQWLPHLILLDVMMPVMDGPATLAHLRENRKTSAIPVVFLTARAKSQELDYLASLGASGAIAKPFEPKELREAVRNHLQHAPPVLELDQEHDRLDMPTAKEISEFRERLGSDAAKLKELRTRLRNGSGSLQVLRELQHVAHRLEGAGGLFGFDNVSSRAGTLERSVREQNPGSAGVSKFERDLDALLALIEMEAAEACPSP